MYVCGAGEPSTAGVHYRDTRTDSRTYPERSPAPVAPRGAKLPVFGGPVKDEGGADAPMDSRLDVGGGLGGWERFPGAAWQEDKHRTWVRLLGERSVRWDS